MSAENCNIDLGCKVRNPLFHRGASQRERLLAALTPDYIKADEHSLEDLLIIAADYAKQINYYDFNNSRLIPPSTEEEPVYYTWTKMIEADPAFVLARIAVTNLSKNRTAFEDKVKKLEENYGSSHLNDDIAEFGAVLAEVTNLASLIDGWYRSSDNSNSIRPIIESFINERLSTQLQNLIKYDKGAELSQLPKSPVIGSSVHYEVDDDNNPNIGKYSFLGDLEVYNSLWKITYNTIEADASIYIGTTPKVKIRNAIEEIRLIFNIFSQAVSQIIISASDLLAQSLENISDHKPHIALFVTFLRLFKYAQDDLNKFTQKHLDYYYKEVLRLAEKEAQPDQVFLIFELAQNVEQHLLTSGTAFEAGQDSLGNDISFEATRDVVLNKGSIDSINTIFVNKDENGTVLDIHAALGANTKNGLGKKPLPDNQFWPLFGETQVGKSESELTMQNASLGFAVASPVLFLKNGNRTITISITPVNTISFDLSDVALVEADLKNSIQIYLSGADKWIQKKANRIILQGAISNSTGDLVVSSLVVEIFLTKDDPEVTSYDQNVLSDTFNAKMPMVKVVFDTREVPVKNFGLQDYDKDHTYYEFNLNATANKKLKPYNSYVLSNGVIYKLVVAQSQNEDPILNPDVWKRIETIDDFIADLDSTDLTFNSQYFYNTGYIVKVGNDYYLAISDSPSMGPSAHPLSPNGAQYWRKIAYEKSFGYQYIADIQFQQVTITADVKGKTDLVLHNEDSDLDPNKPFTPFGSNPDIGSAFYFGSPEIFQKQLSSISLNINWDKLPEENFKSYYVGYEKGVNSVPAIGDKPAVVGSNPSTISINNNSFKVDLEVLDKGKWHSVSNDIALFDTQAILNAEGDLVVDVNQNAPSESRIISVNNSALNKISRDPAIQLFENFQHTLGKGFARLVLKKAIGYNTQGNAIAAPIRMFGNKEYNLLFTNRIINKSTNKLPDLLPNTPYVPVIKELTVDYVSSVTMNLESTNSTEFQNRVDQYFHIEVFGQREVQRLLLEKEEEIFVLPQYHDEGSLYLGLNNISPLQSISILFQFKEGTEDTSIAPPITIQWSYLSNNNWINIPSERISFDSTEKLLKSGIVEIALPEDMTNNNTSLPNGLMWLKVSMSEKTKAINKALRVVAQAIQAKFVDNNNDPARVGTGLPANTIKDLTLRDAEIDAVSQPFASFGGKLQEQDNLFYNRVSERLRHKSRAVNIWDYQRLVLEQFPDVYRAKCLNHTSSINGFALPLNLEEILSTETKPGFVTVVVIPQLKDFITQEVFEPKVGVAMIADIKNYLLKYVSPFVQLEVENALFERVQTKFEVVFKKGLDRAYYTAQLNEDIKRFLAPWAFDASHDITFGGKLQKSVLINFIEMRPYVDYVLHFHLLQQSCLGSDTYKDVDEVIARTSRSVLSSAENHMITALLEEEVVCDDGIGAMITERSFIVR